ncbi:hypothetical protein FB451DRAFT_1274070 [Mycena latifolia]|nr:hypothetical protein FB451DRAFT_1274070 [Mycena latifolia]
MYVFFQQNSCLAIPARASAIIPFCPNILLKGYSAKCLTLNAELNRLLPHSVFTFHCSKLRFCSQSSRHMIFFTDEIWASSWVRAAFLSLKSAVELHIADVSSCVDQSNRASRPLTHKARFVALECSGKLPRLRRRPGGTRKRYKRKAGSASFIHRLPLPSSNGVPTSVPPPPLLAFSIPSEKINPSVMDNNPLAPPAPMSQAPSPVAVVPWPAVPLELLRPVYVPPMYTYHGLPFSLLPKEARDFLTSNDLDDLANYSAEEVTKVRRSSADDLVDSVMGKCSEIAYITVVYHRLRPFRAPDDPFIAHLVARLYVVLLPELAAQMAEHLRLADALVWVDVTARAGGPDALSTDQAVYYRWLQTDVVIGQVTQLMVDLHKWTALMWGFGWRTDASGELYCIAPAAVPVPAPVPAVTDAETDADTDTDVSDSDASPEAPLQPEMQRPSTPAPPAQSPPLPQWSPVRRIRARTSTVPPIARSPPPSPRVAQRLRAYNSLGRCAVPPPWNAWEMADE